MFSEHDVSTTERVDTQSWLEPMKETEDVEHAALEPDSITFSRSSSSSIIIRFLFNIIIIIMFELFYNRSRIILELLKFFRIFRACVKRGGKGDICKIPISTCKICKYNINYFSCRYVRRNEWWIGACVVFLYFHIILCSEFCLTNVIFLVLNLKV